MVLQYDPTGPQVSTTPVPVTNITSGYSATALSQVGSNNSWTNTNVWPVGQISSSTVPVAGEYVEFTINVPVGTDFARVTYDKESYLNDGPTMASIRSSLDGFTSNINTIPVNQSGVQSLSFDLGSMPFVSGGVTFRIYFYGAPTNKGDWADLVSSFYGYNGLRVYVNNLATASDNCGPVTISYSGFASNYQYPKGVNTIVATATDGSNNSTSCNFTITVIDNEPPSITCPPNVTVQCASQVPTPNPGSITAGDNCPGVTVTWGGDVISNQTCANRYTITRTYRATDASNNSRVCTQTITVFDNTPPTISCPSAVAVQCASDVPNADVESVTAADNCGPVSVTWESDVISNQTCANRYTITRTYKATDACGNSATCTQMITVNDDTPPTIQCPPNTTVQCASAVPAPNFAGGSASDNCGGATVTWEGDVISNQTCSNRYTITRTYKATDGCNNSSTCTQIITVFDNVPPTIICPPNVTVQCASAVPPHDFAGGGASDNCGGGVTVEWVSDVISDETCANRFKVTRTYKATDECGNVATCTQIITVFDNTPPTFTRPPDKIIPFLTSCGFDAGISNTGVPTNFQDNCEGGFGFTSADIVSQCGNNIVIKRFWNVFDACGNNSTQMQTITVTDNNTPYIIYASKEAKFGEDNTIKGDVGVTDANGKADFKKNDVLDPYHVYAKNITVQLPSMVNNKHFVPATGGPNPPFMPYSGTGGSGNWTQSVNGTVAGNYRDLTIKKNVVATITGNDFGKITIEEGADVTFTSGVINLQKLEVKKGKKNTTVTKVRFTGCTAIMVKDKVSIEDDCMVNVGGPKVNFYMGDNANDPENFAVHGNNTQVTANIMIPHGQLHVNGGEESNCIMTGWFIIEKLNSDGKNITWNKYGCGPLSIINPDPINARATPEETFQVKVYPNPSSTDFSLQVISTSTEPVIVRIIDVNGIVLKENPPMLKGSIMKMGNYLPSGVYFAEVRQGENRQTVKLVKVN